MEIVPAPLVESPPLTDHVTEAAVPLACLAENCSAALPEELVELQPVQLVSMEIVEGETLKPAVNAVAALPQPARSSTTGAMAQTNGRAARAQRLSRYARPTTAEALRSVSAAIGAMFLSDLLDSVDRKIVARFSEASLVHYLRMPPKALPANAPKRGIAGLEEEFVVKHGI